MPLWVVYILKFCKIFQFWGPYATSLHRRVKFGMEVDSSTPNFIQHVARVAKSLKIAPPPKQVIYQCMHCAHPVSNYQLQFVPIIEFKTDRNCMTHI